jgi:hypothetical protein
MALRTAAHRLLSVIGSGSGQAVRGMASAPVKLPELGYDFGALEPVISGKVQLESWTLGAIGSVVQLSPLIHAVYKTHTS